MASSTQELNIPLVVDLDGTFIKKDLLYEGLKLLLKKNFLHFFSCCFWVLKGKVYLKKRLFQEVKIDPGTLQVNDEVLHFIEKESNKGRKIVLATASLKTSAEEIAGLFPFFHEVYGTENDENLKGKHKLNLLLKMYGYKKFDYIGNSFSDLVIFQSCRYAYLVNASESLEQKISKTVEVKKINP